MTTIRNIIFDFGGVIYDIDFKKSISEFQKLGLENFDELYSKVVQDKLFEKLESDAISPSEFRNELRKQFKQYISDEQMDKAWNALLIGFRPQRIEMLMKIRSNYAIYLLSNTNRIHYQLFLSEFKELTNYNSFDDLFKKAYFSYELKCRKPDSIPYLKVIEDAGIEASETLFIDDSLQNIQPAKDLGIHTYFLDLSKGEDVLDLFKDGKLKEEIVEKVV